MSEQHCMPCPECERLQKENETLKVRLEQAETQLVSSGLGPCTIHAVYAAGCMRCMYSRAQEADALKATVGQVREVLQRCLTRLKAERHMLSGDDETVVVDPRVHGMDVLIPLLEAALDAGKETP